MQARPLPVLAVGLCLLLAACGESPRQRSAGNDASNAHAPGTPLPTPAGGAGSITGMPAAGDGQPVQIDVPGIEELPEDGAEPAIHDPLLADAPPLPAPVTATGTDAPPEPGADAAVQVIRDYYAAINNGDPASAYALWRGRGEASGQTLQQFRNGYADTVGVSLSIGQPGRIEPGAGQRHIEVPVTLTARHADGGQTRYAGSYQLQRSVVDGADAEQRAWRIRSANLREIR
ncbi:hypothetical protein [Luteimonas sp. e5]